MGLVVHFFLFGVFFKSILFLPVSQNLPMNSGPADLSSADRVALDVAIERLCHMRDGLVLKERDDHAGRTSAVSRAKTLRHAVGSAQEEVALLLGYRLEFDKVPFTSSYYELLPDRGMDGDVFHGRVRLMQSTLDSLEARLRRTENLGDVDSLWKQIGLQRSQLISFMMTFKPINARAFARKLRLHLDVMFEALKELHMLDVHEEEGEAGNDGLHDE